MALLGDIIRVATLSLAGLMLLAVAHKVGVVLRSDSRQQPLMQVSPWRQRFAMPLIVAGGTVELVTAVFLVMLPGLGLPLLAVLMGLYGWELRQLDEHQPCNCLGKSLGGSRTAALRRNVVLGVIGVASVLPLLAGWVEIGAVSQATVGVTLILLAVVLSSEVLMAYVRPANVALHRTCRADARAVTSIGRLPGAAARASCGGARSSAWNRYQRAPDRA